MDFFQILVLTLHITQVFTKSKNKKKYRATSSDEDSIENLLYYKDCQRNAKEEPPPIQELMHFEPPPVTTPRQPDCPFPKMCCSLTCGNECGGGQPSFVNRQMEPVQQSFQPIQPIQPIPQPRQPGMGAVQPPLVQRRKKKIKFQPNKMQPPIVGPSRRDFSGGFTKEKIKTLISRDDDIRKILKDLVRVTMQKVDLMDMISTVKSNDVNVITEPAPIAESPFDEYDE